MNFKDVFKTKQEKVAIKSYKDIAWSYLYSLWDHAKEYDPSPESGIDLDAYRQGSMMAKSKILKTLAKSDLSIQNTLKEYNVTSDKQFEDILPQIVPYIDKLLIQYPYHPDHDLPGNTYKEKPKFFVIEAYSQQGRWYVKDKNGFSKAQNELVDGVPEIIGLLVGKEAKRIRIKFSDHAFEGAEELELIYSEPEGSVYQYMKNGRPRLGWLCPVFFHYFANAPEHMYFDVTVIK